ncbi:MAG: tRNA preQ1(34) S-adenosylmethionine ribosyltransferase-isomerase QueA [Paludibacteraceae bacterium]|nr:tRNA preQ1(34) S-adenosylmethionine ribosyltransferase-isomerase QueA [Paludibacteraceae bacterium]
MKLSQFKFDLPEDLIAQYPSEQLHDKEHPSYRRDECRLMVLHRKTGEIERFKKDANGKPIEGNFLDFRNLLDYFDENDLFIFNDTKVFPARLYGTKEKTNAKIEVFLLRELNREMHYWDVLVEPARKIRIGNKLFFTEDENNAIVAEVIDNTTSRGRTLRFLYDANYEEFRRRLFALGETPLPHEVFHRPAEPEDEERYQTIYAREEGAVAAPATGLHFSREMFKRLEIRGIDTYYLTSHIGLGNFKSIDVEDLTKHKMDSEQMRITQELVDRIELAHQKQQRILATGPDVMRALETVVGTDGHTKAYDGWTNKFIFPPYNFTVANAMLSNFCLPLSSMLMLTAAFGGYEQVMEAYELAVKDRYYFGEYGDVMLIVD